MREYCNRVTWSISNVSVWGTDRHKKWPVNYDNFKSSLGAFYATKNVYQALTQKTTLLILLKSCRVEKKCPDVMIPEDF